MYVSSSLYLECAFLFSHSPPYLLLYSVGNVKYVVCSKLTYQTYCFCILCGYSMMMWWWIPHSKTNTPSLITHKHKARTSSSFPLPYSMHTQNWIMCHHQYRLFQQHTHNNIVCRHPTGTTRQDTTIMMTQTIWVGLSTNDDDNDFGSVGCYHRLVIKSHSHSILLLAVRRVCMFVCVVFDWAVHAEWRRKVCCMMMMAAREEAQQWIWWLFAGVWGAILELVRLPVHAYTCVCVCASLQTNILLENKSVSGCERSSSHHIINESCRVKFASPTHIAQFHSQFRIFHIKSSKYRRRWS